MRRMFQTTTALMTSLSLALPPLPLSAQEALTCADGSATPCLPGQEPLTAEGTPVPGTTMTPEEIAARAAAEAAAAEAAAAEAAAAEAAAAEAAAAEAQAQAEAEAKAAEEAAAAEAAAAEQAAAEAAAAQEAAAAAEAEAQAKAAEEAAAAQAAAEAAAAEAAAAEAAAAGAKAAEEAAAAEQAAAAEAQAAAEAEAAAAAQAEAAAEAAANGAAAAEALDEAQAGAAEGAPVQDVPAEDIPVVTEETAPAEEAPVVTEAAVVPPEPTAAELEAALAAELGLTPADAPAGAEAGAAPPVPDLPVQPEAATGEAPVAAAALAEGDPAATPEADAAPAPDAQVVEEVVTEDSVRSSDQDFANKVNVTAADALRETLAAPAAAAAPAEKKDRLSDLEKALLIGLGAVAVGAIISNNRKVELNSGDRVVVSRDDGRYQVIKDDDTLLRQPGSRVRTERFNDGSTRTTVLREDGSRVVTIRDAEYRVLRRVHVDRAGRQTVLIDDTVTYEAVDVTTLPPPARQPVIRDTSDELALRLALEREARITRAFSLAQVRNIAEVRALVPVIDLDAITFDTGSAAITPDQARALSSLGALIQGYIEENPREIFLVEGHTDAVGGAAYNLALSDRRAESVALALAEYFDVPPENLVVQGYGEEFLKIDSQGDVRENRRASVRRITDLLRTAAAE